jgi:hypothetical protein
VQCLSGGPAIRLSPSFPESGVSRPVASTENAATTQIERQQRLPDMETWKPSLSGMTKRLCCCAAAAEDIAF